MEEVERTSGRWRREAEDQVVERGRGAWTQRTKQSRSPVNHRSCCTAPPPHHSSLRSFCMGASHLLTSAFRLSPFHRATTAVRRSAHSLFTARAGACNGRKIATRVSKMAVWGLDTVL